MASPIYRLIADDLRQKIASGQLPSGGQLATELELREHYGASRNTVRDAKKWLINLGLVETRPGQGTFVVEARDPVVAAGSTEEGAVRYLADTLGLRQVGYQDLLTLRTPSVAEAGFFKIPPDGRISVYEIFRTAFDGNGAPTRLTVTVFLADRNQFIVNNGEVPAARRVLSEHAG